MYKIPSTEPCNYGSEFRKSTGHEKRNMDTWCKRKSSLRFVFNLCFRIAKISLSLPCSSPLLPSGQTSISKPEDIQPVRRSRRERARTKQHPMGLSSQKYKTHWREKAPTLIEGPKATRQGQPDTQMHLEVLLETSPQETYSHGEKIPISNDSKI